MRLLWPTSQDPYDLQALTPERFLDWRGTHSITSARCYRNTNQYLNNISIYNKMFQSAEWAAGCEAQGAFQGITTLLYPGMR